MKIAPINQHLYNRKNNTTSATFTGKTKLDYRIKKVVLKEIESREVYNKASELLNKLPNCKMEATFVCKVGDKQYGIRWNTKDENKLSLKIKDKIYSKTNEEWNENKAQQTVLDCIFDSRGVMQSGYITKNLKPNYSLSASFQRGNCNHKTIVIDGITYRPYPENNNYWTSMPSLSCYNIKKDINLKDILKPVELSELFCELTQHTTIR